MARFMARNIGRSGSGREKIVNDDIQGQLHRRFCPNVSPYVHLDHGEKTKYALIGTGCGDTPKVDQKEQSISSDWAI